MIRDFHPGSGSRGTGSRIQIPNIVFNPEFRIRIRISLSCQIRIQMKRKFYFQQVLKMTEFSTVTYVISMRVPICLVPTKEKMQNKIKVQQPNSHQSTRKKTELILLEPNFDPHKESNFKLFQCFLSSCTAVERSTSVADTGCLSRIPDPDFYPSRIPNLRIQKRQ